MWLGQVKGGTNTAAALDGLGSGIFPKWLKMLLSYVADAFSCKALLFSVDTAQCPEGTEMASRESGYLLLLCGSKVPFVSRKRLLGRGSEGLHWVCLK